MTAAARAHPVAMAAVPVVASAARDRVGRAAVPVGRVLKVVPVAPSVMIAVRVAMIAGDRGEMTVVNRARRSHCRK